MPPEPRQQRREDFPFGVRAADNVEMAPSTSRLTVTSALPVAAADPVTIAGHCAEMLVLANAISGIFEALRRASARAPNGLS